MKKPQNHGVPYSLTEDFTSVYRMHSLLPDQLHILDIDDVPGTNKSLPLIQEYNSTFIYIHLSPILKFPNCKKI